MARFFVIKMVAFAYKYLGTTRPKKMLKLKSRKYSVI